MFQFEFEQGEGVLSGKCWIVESTSPWGKGAMLVPRVVQLTIPPSLLATSPAIGGPPVVAGNRCRADAARDVVNIVRRRS